MPPRRRPAPGVPALLGLAAAAAAATAALYGLAVRTEAGQRLDDAALGDLGGAGWARAREATNDLLDTISVSSLTLIGAAIMAIALARGRPRLAIGAGVLVLGANVTTQLMKARLGRPDLAGETLQPASFPSGHVTVAMSLAMALMLVAPPALRWPATALGCAYAMGVGVAVVALDWHRPSDVLGAYLVTVAWTAAVAAALAAGGRRALGATGRRPSPRARLAAAALVGAGAVGAAAVVGRASTRLDLLRVVDDQTTFAAAAVVCALSCAALGAATALLVQRATLSPPGGRPSPGAPRRVRLAGVRVGVLTGGGDCPGLNAVIRAVVRVGARLGQEHVGLRHGWRGLLERDTAPLDREIVGPIAPRGGTILRSSRTNPFKDEGGGEECARAFADLGLDALVAIGGEDTLGVARRLHDEHGLAVVGVPKTIDNDLSGTDYTFGFWTAVQIATDAIDRLHTTAESHDRVIVVEVMGRHAGWIALESGLAGGAHAILIPERPPSVEAVCERIRGRRGRGSPYAIVVVSEGVELGEGDEAAAVDEFGHAQLAKVGVGERLADRISEATGAEARAVVLGHVQRGGSPIAFDRVLATRYGVRAAELVSEGAFGRMVALRADHIVNVPLAEAVSELKTVPEELYRRYEAVVAGP